MASSLCYVWKGVLSISNLASINVTIWSNSYSFIPAIGRTLYMDSYGDLSTLWNDILQQERTVLHMNSPIVLGLKSKCINILYIKADCQAFSLLCSDLSNPKAKILCGSIINPGMGVEIVIVPPCAEMFASGLPPPPADMGPTLYIFFITDIHPKKALQVLKDQRDSEVQKANFNSKVLQSSSSLNTAGSSNNNQNSNFDKSGSSYYYKGYVDQSLCTNLLYSETQVARNLLVKKIPLINDHKKAPKPSSKGKSISSSTGHVLNKPSSLIEQSQKHSNSNGYLEVDQDSKLTSQAKIKRDSKKRKRNHKKKNLSTNSFEQDGENLFSSSFIELESEPHNTYIYCSGVTTDNEISEVCSESEDEKSNISPNVIKKIYSSKVKKSRSSKTAYEKISDCKIEKSLSSKKIQKLFSESETDNSQDFRAVEENLSSSKIKRSLKSKRIRELFSSPEVEKPRSSKVANDKHRNSSSSKAVHMSAEPKIEISRISKTVEEQPCDFSIKKSLKSKRIHDLFSSPESEKSKSSKIVDETYSDSKLKKSLNSKTIHRKTSEHKIERIQISKTSEEKPYDSKINESSNSNKIHELFSDPKNGDSQSSSIIEEKLSKSKSINSLSSKTVKEISLSKAQSSKIVDDKFIESTIKNSQSFKSVDKKLFDSKVGNHKNGTGSEVITDVFNSDKKKKDALTKISGIKDEDKGIIIECSGPALHLLNNIKDKLFDDYNEKNIDFDSNNLCNKDKNFPKNSRNIPQKMKRKEKSGKVLNCKSGRECRLEVNHASDLQKFGPGEKIKKNCFAQSEKLVGAYNLSCVDKKYLNLYHFNDCHVILHDIMKSSVSIVNEVIIPSRRNHISNGSLKDKNSKSNTHIPSKLESVKSIMSDVMNEVPEQSKILSDGTCKNKTVLTKCNNINEHVNFISNTTNNEFYENGNKSNHIKNIEKILSVMENVDYCVGKKVLSKSKGDKYKFFKNAGTNIFMHKSKLHKSKCQDSMAIANHHVLKEGQNLRNKHRSLKHKNGEIYLKNKREKLLSQGTFCENNSPLKSSLYLLENFMTPVENHEATISIIESEAKLSQVAENIESVKPIVEPKSEYKSRYCLEVHEGITLVSEKDIRKDTIADKCYPSQNIIKTNETFPKSCNDVGNLMISPVKDCDSGPHVTDLQHTLKLKLAKEEANCQIDGKSEQAIYSNHSSSKEVIKSRNKENERGSKHRSYAFKFTNSNNSSISASIKEQDKLNFNHIGYHINNNVIIAGDYYDLDNIMFMQEPNEKCSFSEKSVTDRNLSKVIIVKDKPDRSIHHKNLLQLKNENLGIEHKQVSESKLKKYAHSKPISPTKQHGDVSNIKHKHLVENDSKSSDLAKSLGKRKKHCYSHDQTSDRLKLNGCNKFTDSKVKSLSLSNQKRFMKYFGKSKVVLNDISNLSKSEFYKLTSNIKVERHFLKKYYRFFLKSNGNVRYKSQHHQEKVGISNNKVGKKQTLEMNSNDSKINVIDIKNETKLSADHNKDKVIVKIPVHSSEKLCKDKSRDMQSKHNKDKIASKLNERLSEIPGKSGEVQNLYLNGNSCNNFDNKNQLLSASNYLKEYREVSDKDPLCFKQKGTNGYRKEFFKSPKQSLKEKKDYTKEKCTVINKEDKNNQLPTNLNDNRLFCDSSSLHEKKRRNKSLFQQENGIKGHEIIQSPISLKNERSLSKRHSNANEVIHKLKNENKKFFGNISKNLGDHVKGPSTKEIQEKMTIMSHDKVNVSLHNARKIEKKSGDKLVKNLPTFTSLDNFKIPKLNGVKNQVLKDFKSSSAICLPEKYDNIDFPSLKNRNDNCYPIDGNNNVNAHYKKGKYDYCSSSSECANYDASASFLDENFFGAVTSSPRRVVLDTPIDNCIDNMCATSVGKCTELLRKSDYVFQSTKYNHNENIVEVDNYDDALRENNSNCNLFNETTVYQCELINKGSCSSRAVVHSEYKEATDHISHVENHFSFIDDTSPKVKNFCNVNKGNNILIRELQSANSWSENDQKSLFSSCTKFSKNILDNICCCSDDNKCILRVFYYLNSSMEESSQVAKSPKFGCLFPTFLKSGKSSNLIASHPLEENHTSEKSTPITDVPKYMRQLSEISSVVHTNMDTAPTTNDDFVHLIKKMGIYFESKENIASLAKNLSQIQHNVLEKSSKIEEDMVILKEINYIQTTMVYPLRNNCKSLVYGLSRKLTADNKTLPSDVINLKVSLEPSEKSHNHISPNSTKVLGLPYSLNSAVQEKKADNEKHVTCCRKIMWIKMKDFLKNDQYFANLEDGSLDKLAQGVAHMKIVFQKKTLHNFVNDKKIQKILYRPNVSFAIYTFVEEIHDDHTEEILHEGCLYLFHHTAMIDRHLYSLINSLSSENKLKPNVKNLLYLPRAIHHLCEQLIIASVNDCCQERINLKENLALIRRLSNDTVMLKSKEVLEADNIKETSSPDDYLEHLKLFHAKLRFAHRRVALIIGYSAEELSTSEEFYKILTVQKVLSARDGETPY